MPQAELGLSLGETKAMADVDLERLRKFARRAGVPDRLVVGVASETAERLREAWANDPVTDLLPAAIRATLDAHLERMPLGRAATRGVAPQADTHVTTLSPSRSGLSNLCPPVMSNDTSA